jgi:hypothetical protein
MTYSGLFLYKYRWCLIKGWVNPTAAASSLSRLWHPSFPSFSSGPLVTSPCLALPPHHPKNCFYVCPPPLLQPWNSNSGTSVAIIRRSMAHPSPAPPSAPSLGFSTSVIAASIFDSPAQCESKTSTTFNLNHEGRVRKSFRLANHIRPRWRWAG